MKILTFQEAIDQSEAFSRRHILLGNGFSIACRPDIFVYGKLLERADFSKLSANARNVFDSLGTQDFERVIKALRDAVTIINTYKVKDSGLANTIAKDADGLREVLVQAIASSHPESPNDLSDDEYLSCRTFLSHFNTVYTLNYDLLLYWTQMHVGKGERPGSDDGFRAPYGEFDSEYVTWEPHQSHDQNTWYLHGALHVFDTGTEIQKFTWSRTNIRLIEQIRDALQREYFPLFVAEGTTAEKVARIRHSDYLAKAYRSFSEIQHALFIFGHSLAENDDHYLKRIERGKVRHLYVGLHGAHDSSKNKKIIKRALAMPKARRGNILLDVSFYDTETTNVWR